MAGYGLFDDKHHLGHLPPVWSPSMVKRYSSCPRAWALIYGRLLPSSAIRLTLHDLPEGGQGIEVSHDPISRSQSRPQSMGTLAHTGMEGAYLGARDIPLRTVRMLMDRFEADAVR